MPEPAPRCVSCPEPLASLFVEAEKNMGDFFEGLRFAPEDAEIKVGDERYILARAATFSVQLKAILEEEYGRLAAEKIAFNLGRASGTKDAEFFMEKHGLEKGPQALSAGPVHFAYTGWAYVDIFPESRPSMDEDFLLIYDHPSSFEADSFLKEKKWVSRPVCHMNAGYSSGWCQVAFGVELTAKEISCRARGDDMCLFVMGHPSRINHYVAEVKDKYSIV